MRQSSSLYLTFSLLAMGVMVVVMLLYRYISPETASSLTLPSMQIPADLQAVLQEVGARDGWIYKMQLQQKQNIFSYPRTVYHINLN